MAVRLQVRLTTAAIAVTMVVSGCAAPDTSPDQFQELLGVSAAEVDAKIDAAWSQLFYGSDTEERIYYPVGDDLAYIPT